MEETQEDGRSNMRATPSTEVIQQIAIEAEDIFRAAMHKLGSDQHNIQFKRTHDQKYFAILDVKINSYPYTEDPKENRIYSYFHDTIKDAKDDVYSGAVDWLESELNLTIDIRANKKLKEAKEKLEIANAMASIIEGKYITAADEARKIGDQKKQAMTQILATAEKIPGLLCLTENTTPLKANSISYPHMVYRGRDPPPTEKEKLAQCLSEVFSILKLS